MDRSHILGVILAGGQSRRMGTDKAKLQINGVSMLQRNLHLFSECGFQDVVVCRNHPDYLADIHVNCGPMGAIHSALHYAQKKEQIKGLIIIPIDMPLLDKELINQLIVADEKALAFFSKNKPSKNNKNELDVSVRVTGDKAINPARHFQNTPLPLFLPNHSSLLSLSEAVATSSADRSIKAFLSRIDCESIISQEPEKLVNTNDKAQWQQALDVLDHIS
ncbi:molybdenum cofactor guanylyltransferase [uncultured Shewanella sp.]|uniref:molybdenum cofactor guanylyltransferase n=1 Tax=uncultured Shewanella sp. TaxID=173975 RepID=UPI0026295335|nr:molybdenum cofactor guanylyltransferase [uncultured Shewanella sp.]